MTLRLLLCLWLGVGCAHPHAAAPFRAKPDSTQAGRLAGPFTGRIFETAGKAPVAGAVVVGAWHITSANGPLPTVVKVTTTDSAGEYALPAVTAPAAGTLVEFVLTAYKRGYVGYRSDTTFGGAPRRDFAQTQHWIEFERWAETLSHAAHVRYLGGGPLATVTAWELDLAAAEQALPSRPSVLATGRRLVAAQLLQADFIKAKTSFDGQFETGPLGDEPDSTTYSSQHWKALGRTETFDVALRMWTLPPDEAEKRYVELTEQLPGVTERDELGTRSFRAAEATVHAAGVLDKGRGAVMLITCGASLCTSPESAVLLLRTAHERLVVLLGGRI